MNVLDECFQLFDNNTYKIVVIEDYNKGGLMMLATYFTEYFYKVIGLGNFPKFKI